MFNLCAPQVDASYTPDVWGLNQRTVESLQAQADMQKFPADAAYLTLTSNVALVQHDADGLKVTSSAEAAASKSLKVALASASLASSATLWRFSRSKLV